MVHDTEASVKILIDGISKIDEVQSIGISGGKTSFPKAGEGDIDIFIYCSEVPAFVKRQKVLNQLGSVLKDIKMNMFEKGHWGVGDFVLINGVETWLMYFTVNETLNEIEAILNGNYPDKLDNYYYPVGRCAMLKNINTLYDKNGFLQALKNRLSEYPDMLSEILTLHHLEALDDTEDLERAVTRKDVLFYHFAIDLAIDHFLQALFAINRTYFPSRKRTADYIDNFIIKPDRCNARLLEVIRLGACPDSISESYKIWKVMAGELKKKSEYLKAEHI